jgi:ArsR family transcriptional regulator, arsenate/arsenite/antimonite-responsive transcriptional repressor
MAVDTLERSTRLLKALADPVRLRLLNLLSDGREVCVCDLHGSLDLPQPTVSRHLAYLRRSGVVVASKDGLWVRYRLATPTSHLHRTLLNCVPLVDPKKLERDRMRLAQLMSCRECS